jgi:hypothetical protein
LRDKADVESRSVSDEQVEATDTYRFGARHVEIAVQSDGFLSFLLSHWSII